MFHIEKACLSDVEVIAKLAKEIWEEHFTLIIGKEQVAYMVDKFQSYKAIKKQIKEEGYTYYKLLEDTLLVGYMAVVFEEEKTFLSKLYLVKSARGKHYATYAINFLVEECKKRDCHILWLTCNKENTTTIAKYEKLGFKKFDSVVKDIGNDYVMDDYYFRKTF